MRNIKYVLVKRFTGEKTNILEGFTYSEMDEHLAATDALRTLGYELRKEQNEAVMPVTYHFSMTNANTKL